MSLNNHKNITPPTIISKNQLIQYIKQSSHKSINPFKLNYYLQNKSKTKSIFTKSYSS